MLHTLLWSYMGAANTRGKCWQAVMNTMLWAQNSQFGVFDYKFFFFFFFASGLSLFFSPMEENS